MKNDSEGYTILPALLEGRVELEEEVYTCVAIRTCT